MVTNHHQESDLIDYILSIVQREKPNTVKQLIQYIQRRYPVSEEELTQCILNLRAQGRLTLQEHISPSSSITAYLRGAYWYWWIVTITLITTTLIFLITDAGSLYIYMRYIIASFFVIFVPGYSFIRALFPDKFVIPAPRQIDKIERLALSVGVSIAIGPLIGLLLNYTPWGIRAQSITLSLVIFTAIFATIALAREYHMRTTT